MRIVSIRSLREFWERHPRAEMALRGWYAEASHAQWKAPGDVKAARRNAGFLPDNRIVFNIKGNEFRLVVAVRYTQGLIFVRFIGTHAEYDRNDAATFQRYAMTIKPIHSEADYQAALSRIEALWNAPDGSEEADQLEVLSMLVEAYEKANYPIAAPDPVDFLLYIMEARELTRKDLEPYIGPRGRVSDILNRVRPLTLDMIRRLSAGLELPATVLIQDYPLRREAA